MKNKMGNTLMSDDLTINPLLYVLVIGTVLINLHAGGPTFENDYINAVILRKDICPFGVKDGHESAEDANHCRPHLNSQNTLNV